MERSDALAGWMVRLRWVALAGVATVIASAGWTQGGLPPGAEVRLWSTAAALFTYNLALWLLKGRANSGLGRPAFQIAVDCTALALLVHFAGGIENPFLPLFVLHVVNANIALRPRSASAILGFVIALVIAIAVGEGTGLLPHHCLYAAQSDCEARAFTAHSVAVLAGLILTLVAASGFARFLTRRLRESRRQLSQNLEALSREKERLAKSQEVVELERARLRAIVEGMADAVVFADRDGNVQLSNKPAQDILSGNGMASENNPLSKHRLAERLVALEHQQAVQTESPMELGNRTLEPTFSTVRTRRGDSIGLVAVMRDISARHSLEKHLMHEERMNVVGKLAASVAHEINNPIGVVSLYCQHALTKLPVDSPVYKNLEVIKRNADSCRKITEQLLELARPRRPERRAINLRSLCDEVLDSVRPLAEQQGVTLAGDSRTERVPLWAECDVEQIRQALLNLALNAVEATPRGRQVQIRAYEAQDGEVVARVVEVADDGPGIAADQLDRIFQPFFTTKDGGTGLGLSVAENIVKGHAGRMTVQCPPRGGAQFRVFLPAIHLAPAPGVVAEAVEP